MLVMSVQTHYRVTIFYMRSLMPYHEKVLIIRSTVLKNMCHVNENDSRKTVSKRSHWISSLMFNAYIFGLLSIDIKKIYNSSALKLMQISTL